MGAAPSLHAQEPRELTSSARISLLTVLPGEGPVYTAFGHSAFRVHDPRQGIDLIFNYGTFDYSDPFFIPKFIYGDTRYMVSVSYFRPLFNHYTSVQNRSVIEQTLNLSPAQVNGLFRYLQINARPENRYYQYLFLFDNCSTRARDVLVDVLGSDVQFAERPDPQRSFRRLLDPYVADMPWLDFGFDLGLGAPADQIPTPADAVFLPLLLMESFAYASVRNDDAWQPLVAATDTLYQAEGETGLTYAPDWPEWLAWSLLALAVVAAVYRRRNPDAPALRFGRIADALLLGVVGFAGVIIAFLWFIAIHNVTDPNWNLIWAWPTHLVAAYLIARGREYPWVHYYWIAAAAGAAIAVLGWPFWPQDLPAAALPLTLLVGLRSAMKGFTLR